jgi:hypothetical protein
LETTCAGSGSEEMPVYHVLNPHREPTWSQMLAWLQKKEYFDIVSPMEWVERLEACADAEHSALKLLGLWKEAYGNGEQASSSRPQFSMMQTRKRVPSLRDVKALDEEYVGRIWEWIQDNVQ